MLRSFLLICLVTLISARVEQYRVVNGKQVGDMQGEKVVNPGEFRFLVHLIHMKNVEGSDHVEVDRCGGSIIQKDVILTAAHCVKGAKPEDISVVAGRVNIAIKSDGSQIAKVDRIEVHEEFSEKPINNDIALLFLTEPLIPSEYINIINPPDEADYTLGKLATAAGWGLNEHGETPKWLHKTDLLIIPNVVCQMFIEMEITDNMICAIDQKTSTVCQGDSGGPLVHNGHVIGVSSFLMQTIQLPSGKVTCDTKYPAVFTKVINYMGWVNKHIKTHKKKKCYTSRY